MDKIKLTGLEKRWILYDVGNSAFTLLISTIIPIYFNDLAGRAGISEVDYLAYWGYAASLATAIVAVIGPVLGTIADTQNYKKPIFTASMMLGVLGCAALSLPTTWIVFLAVFVLARVGYSASLIFYDSMLVDVTDNDRMDVVSSHGYAWGYIGSCVPFVLSLGADPVVVGSLALTCGYCGTLCTPMAANFNMVPVAVLEMKDKNGVIKKQVLIGIIMLILQIIYMIIMC